LPKALRAITNKRAADQLNSLVA